MYKQEKNSDKVHPVVWFMLFVIFLISMIDLFLAVRLLEPQSKRFAIDEKNPIIVWLVGLTDDFSIFIPAKILGTVICILLAKRLYIKNNNKGFLVCSVVCFLQIMLLIYLFFGKP